jgi:hypothetical protein
MIDPWAVHKRPAQHPRMAPAAMTNAELPLVS